MFGTLFTYWFWARAHVPQWPPAGLPELGLGFVVVNTVFLLSSGVTAHAAQRSLEAGNPSRFGALIGATLVLGGLFLVGQGYEYLTAGFGPSSGPYGSAFFGLMGVHGLHVLMGLVALGAILVLVTRGIIGRDRSSGVSAGDLYWHWPAGRPHRDRGVQGASKSAKPRPTPTPP